MMLIKTNLLGMIGKAERGSIAIKSIKKYSSVYLIAVGGSAYLISKAIESAKIIAFKDIGMEAVREFYVEDMPVTVAVDSLGKSIHTMGSKKWSKITHIPDSSVHI